MRILLALDGSPGGEIARDLVRSLRWPEPSTVDALRVVEPVFDVFSMAAVEVDGSLETLLGVDASRESLEAEVEDLTAPSLAVETHVTIGRPATVVVETAERLGSDLIVIGSRGRGPIGTMVLGSVSAEVVDHALCPVLVARRPTARRAVVALDGTPMSERIVDEIADWTFLRRTHLQVVGVAPSTVPGPGVMLSGAYGAPITWYEDAVAATRGMLEDAASTAAQRLRSSGYDVEWTVPEGDPAGTILETAERGGADLIVVGTHGRTGLTRLLLGSVARNVLLHARASVLVVRSLTAAGTD